MKLNVQRHLTYRLWRLASLLWAEHKFNCGITSLRKAEKMAITMLVLVARTHWSSKENDFWIIVDYYWRGCWWCWHIIRLMSSNFYVCFRHEMLGSEDCYKIAKFWAKTTSHGHGSGEVDEVQRRSRFDQKDLNWWRIMDVRLWYWNQSPIIQMEASSRAKTEKSLLSSVKYGGFAHCFLWLQWSGASGSC